MSSRHAWVGASQSPPGPCADCVQLSQIATPPVEEPLPTPSEVPVPPVALKPVPRPPVPREPPVAPPVLGSPVVPMARMPPEAEALPLVEKLPPLLDADPQTAEHSEGQAVEQMQLIVELAVRLAPVGQELAQALAQALSPGAHACAQLVNEAHEGLLLQATTAEAQAPPGFPAASAQLSQALDTPVEPLPPLLEPTPGCRRPDAPGGPGS